MSFFNYFFSKNKTILAADAPVFVQSYMDLFKEKMDKKTIETCRFVVFDTETTGIRAEKDKILSIGALAIEQSQISVAESFELFVQQNDIVGNEAIDVHGILKNGKKIKISEAEAIQKFIEFCKDSVLVGHHIRFDVNIINQHLKANYGIVLQNKLIDTGNLAKRTSFFLDHYHQPSDTELSLDFLAKKYNIETFDRHKALGDAYITAILFLKLLYQLRIDKKSDLKNLFL